MSHKCRQTPARIVARIIISLAIAIVLQETHCNGCRGAALPSYEQVQQMIILRYLQANNTVLEWVAPCGHHDIVGNASTDLGIQRLIQNELLHQLRFHIHHDYRYIRRNSRISELLDDEGNYAHLPRLRSKVLADWSTLLTCYHDLQLYVAAFAYLERRQYAWDLSHTAAIGTTTFELDKLFGSARRIACELERTVRFGWPDVAAHLDEVCDRTCMAAKLSFSTSRSQQINVENVKAAYLKYVSDLGVALEY